MALAGLVVTLLGFVIAFASLGLTDSVNTRMIMALAGIAISFTGILGMINKAYQKNADWRK
jgi:hypothetical protein